MTTITANYRINYNLIQLNKCKCKNNGTYFIITIMYVKCIKWQHDF